MRQTARRFTSASAAALALALLASSATLSYASSISYGNFGPVPPGISFLNVTESSPSSDPIPLYGAPNILASTLDFDPKNFSASTAGGGADITDGQLNFTLAGQKIGNNVTAIKAISLYEAGDFALLGGGTSATQVQASAVMLVKVTEIDGVAITPINLPFTNSSVAYNVAANPGSGQFWSTGLLVNVEGQLSALGVPFAVGATKADVVVNNTLLAISEPANIAFIAKKDFVIGFEPEIGVVPEPGSIAMAGLALCGIGLAGRRKK